MSESSAVNIEPKQLLSSVDHKTPTQLRRFFMWFCAASFYCIQFVLRTSPTTITNDLMQDLSLDSLGLAFLVSWYYYGYSAMQIPSGILLDRIGARRPLLAACLLCLIGSFIFALSESCIALSMGRLMMGIGSAFGFVSCVKIASQAFKRQHLSMYISLSLLIGTTGAVSAGKPFALMVDYLNWRNVYLILAFIIFALALAVWMIIPEENKFNLKATPEDITTAPRESVFESVFVILKAPHTWLFGLFGFMMYVPLAGFADLWGAPYLMEVYHLNRQEASTTNSLIYIGIGLGGPLWSMYVAKVKSYKSALFLGSLSTLALLSVLLYVPHLPFYVCSIILFLIGAAATSQFIAFAGITELNLPHHTGLASGVHNMLCMLSGVVMQPLLGYILKVVWNGAYVSGLPHYTQTNFQIALILLPIAAAIAVVPLLYVKESYPKHG